MSGHLTILVGPMFASKTSTLCLELNKYIGAGLNKVCYINHVNDVRDVDVSTHNNGGSGLSPDVARIKAELLNKCDVSPYSVIGIDEAQFFNDLLTTVKDWINYHGKIVIVAGLDSYADCTKWGQITDLSIHADVYKKLRAKCASCARHGILRDALFTATIDGNLPSVGIGGCDKYVALCRMHHNQKYEI